MKNKIIFLITFFCFLYLQVNAQSYGKLYTKAEANNLYGAVKQSVQISTSQLKSLVDKAPEVIMFNLINNKLVLLSQNRNLLFSSGEASFTDNDVFTVYSTSKIKELIETGKSDITYFEKRENVLSVTNGESTLEFGTICPPFCN